MGIQSAIEAGRACVKLLADDSELRNGLQRAETRLKLFGETLRNVGFRIGLMGGAMLAPMIKSVQHFMSYGTQLEMMRRKTGISAESLSILGYAARSTGTDMDMMDFALRRMARSIDEATRGGGQAVRSFQELGLSIDDLLAMSPEQRFFAIGQAISRITDESGQAAMAQRVFGRGGTAMLPMLENGIKGLEEYAARARELGVVMTGDALTGAYDLYRGWQDLLTVLDVTKRQIAMALLPTLKELAAKTIAVVKTTADWVAVNKELVVTIGHVAGLLTLGGGLLVVLGQVTVTAALVPMALRNIHLALAGLIAHPVIAGLVAVGLALGGIWYAIHRSDKATSALKSNTAEVQKLADRYGALTKQSTRTAEEQLELLKIVDKLRTVFPEYADAIDGTVDALKRLEKVMPLSEAERFLKYRTKGEEVAGVIKRIGELETRMAAARTAVAAGVPLAPKYPTAGFSTSDLRKATYEKDVLPLEAERNRLLREALALKQEMYGLYWKPVPEREAGPAAEILTEEQTKAEEEWARKANDLRLALIEDDRVRRLALIDEEYAREAQKLAEIKATEDAYFSWALSKIYERQAVNQDADRKVAAEKKRMDEEAERNRERIASANAGRMREVAELEARLKYGGIRLERELLMLRAQQELQAARRAGEDLSVVQRKFALEWRLLDVEAAAKMKPAMSVTGQWGGLLAGQAMGGGGGPADRTARATEKTAAGVERLLEAARTAQGPLFGGAGY